VDGVRAGATTVLVQHPFTGDAAVWMRRRKPIA